MALSRVKVWGTEVLTAADLNAEFDNILSNASSLISPLGGALDWDGYAHTLDAAGVTTAQSTSTIGWSFTPGNKSGTPGTTGGISNWAASTWTDSNTAGSGTAASWAGHAFQRPTLAASNSSVTTTNAATVYIANNVAAGSNETLTNSWAMWVDAGNVRFDDDMYWYSGTTFQGILAHNNTANRTYTFPDYDITALPSAAATQAEQETGTSTTTFVSPGRQHYHTSAAKAWVNFNGTGTVAIRASYNVTSITDNGTGDYTVNITSAFTDTNYGFYITTIESGSAVFFVPAIGASLTKATTSLRFGVRRNDTDLADADNVNVVMYR